MKLKIITLTQSSLSQQNLLKLEKVNPSPEGRSEAEGLSFGGGSIKFLAERIGNTTNRFVDSLNKLRVSEKI